MRPVIIALHGFLGLPQDWGRVYHEFLDFESGVDFIAVDYMNDEALCPKNDFSTWALNFNLKTRQQFPNRKKILLGYSLGGRLALEALKQNASQWDAAVFVSSTGGMRPKENREERFNNDLVWADRFANSDWSLLMLDWNKQEIFKDDPEQNRIESDYDREMLSLALKNWSLAKQESFHEWIFKSRKRMTWIAGDFDKKYSEILNQLKFSPENLNVQKCIVPHGGHRLFYSHPRFIAEKLSEVVQSVENQSEI